MLNQPPAVQSEPVYLMKPETLESLQKIKDHVHGICSSHMNRPVRAQTIHGQAYDGFIVHIDATHIFLRPLDGHVRGFFNPTFNPYAFNNVILPLVLYELLVISLL
ncbi:hypothetical protein [Paenibacillus piri]|uniref:Uncharacterized protein n=1 Tax=Paenibacillus piri TaxID=2547395 RepID=A0A4R5KYP1_9BACL|nr:hypothetical protein [Paenibacillus piri]TDG00713.1 hypothetical protein E1757_03560 [Paenibacillus piri]